MGIPDQERSLTISLAIWIKYMKVTNVTDRWTDTGRQQNLCLPIASCSKNYRPCYNQQHAVLVHSNDLFILS